MYMMHQTMLQSTRTAKFSGLALPRIRKRESAVNRSSIFKKQKRGGKNSGKKTA
jgi:hypothetical protein